MTEQQPLLCKRTHLRIPDSRLAMLTLWPTAWCHVTLQNQRVTRGVKIFCYTPRRFSGYHRHRRLTLPRIASSIIEVMRMLTGWLLTDESLILNLVSTERWTIFANCSTKIRQRHKKGTKTWLDKFQTGNDFVDLQKNEKFSSEQARQICASADEHWLFHSTGRQVNSNI